MFTMTPTAAAGQGSDAGSGPFPAGGSGTTSAADPTGPVLVVDDDPDIREAMTDLLEDRGFAVLSAADGAEALALLRSLDAPPSAILLDLMMPGLDGYGFLDEQRRDPALVNIPVVIITAGQGIDQARIGATPVLAKPIKVAQLMTMLARLRGSGHQA